MNMQVLGNKEEMLSERDLYNYFEYPPKGVSKQISQGITLMVIFGAIFASITYYTRINSLWLVLVMLLSGIPMFIGIIRLIIYRMKARPTDEQYEAWVRSWIPSLRQYGLQRLHLEQSDIVGSPLFVRGIVWFDSQDAKYYHSHRCPVRVLRGKDGNLHASINRITFFYPTQHYIAAFSGDINALSSLRFEATQSYFYNDIVGVETSAFGLQVEEGVFGMQNFVLRVSSGHAIGATTYSHDADVDQTVRSLRTLLRDKKYGMQGGPGLAHLL
jgi:hypothetical protein